MSKLIAKINLEQFRNKVNEWRQTNNFKAHNSMTTDDMEYYCALGIGFEKAISIFLMCADYVTDGDEEVKQ